MSEGVSRIQNATRSASASSGVQREAASRRWPGRVRARVSHTRVLLAEEEDDREGGGGGLGQPATVLGQLVGCAGEAR